MNSSDVVGLYEAFEAQRVRIWIDGGWCVDALLGEQTRDHSDLDVAVDRRDEPRMQAVLASLGFHAPASDMATACNYVLIDQPGRRIDVHVFAYEEDGGTYGIQYPRGSLTGHGVIVGCRVRCVAPAHMFRFKTAYPPAEKDRLDVQALSRRYGFALPESHR